MVKRPTRTAKQTVVFRDRAGNRQSCICGCKRFRRILSRTNRYKCAKCGRWYKVVKKKEKTYEN